MYAELFKHSAIESVRRSYNKLVLNPQQDYNFSSEKKEFLWTFDEEYFELKNALNWKPTS